MKKAFIIVLVTVALFLPSQFSVINASDAATKNEKSVEIANELREIFLEKGLQSKSTFSEMNGSAAASPKFSEEYGGVFIDEKNNLHLLLTKDGTDRLRGIQSQYESKGLSIDVVSHSYNSLKNAQNKIFEAYKRLSKVDEYNGIDVTLLEDRNIIQVVSDVPFQEFPLKALINELNKQSLMVEYIFQEVLSNPENESSIHGGGKFTAKTGEGVVRGDCSVGYKSYRDGRVGFTTAGHCWFDDKTVYVISETGPRYYAYYPGSNTIIGTVINAKRFNGIDVAFVESNGYDVSNYANYSNINSFYHTGGNSNYIVKGQSIAKFGFNGYGQATVTEVSKNILRTDNSVQLMDVFIYSNGTVNLTAPGDSGGVLLGLNKEGTMNYAIGIHIGTYGNPVNKIGVKANNINDNLGLN